MNSPNSSAQKFTTSTYSLVSWIFIIGSVLLLIAKVVLKIKDGLFFDDTYMFVRYADNIIKYGNYGWNAGEHTYGCTNIPFTYFIVVLKLLHLDKLFGLSTMLLLACLFWAVASLLLLYKTILLLTRNTFFDQPLLVTLLICLISVTDVFSYNVITGMDTMMSVFFNTLMVYLLLNYLSKPSRLNFILSVFFSYFIFLLRPDCGIYTVLLPFLFLWEAKIPFKKIIVFYVGIVFLLALDSFIKYTYFGNVLPLPFYIKKGGFYTGYIGRSLWNPLTYTFDFLFEFSFVVFLLFLFVTKKALRKFLVFAVPVIVGIMYYFTVVQIMGHNSRYYLPSMPFWVIGAVYGLREIKSFNLVQQKILLPVLFAAALLLIQSLAPLYKIYVDKKTKQEAAAFQLPASDSSIVCKKLGYNEMVQKALKLMTVLPDSTTIAATEHGYISAFLPGKKILDLCGLHDLDIAVHGYRDDVLAKWKPEIIWLPATDYTSLRKNVITGTNFKELYTYLPGALNYGIGVLKTSPNHDAIINKVMELNCQ